MGTIIGEGSASDRDSLALETTTKRRIRNVRRLEAPPDRRKAVFNLFKSTFTYAEIRSVSQCYNCMGLVFASRRTCLEIDDLQDILNDDGYRPLPNSDVCDVGDVVVYKRDHVRTHVGIIIKKERRLENGTWKIFVMSQWGWDAEVIHPLESVHPEYGIAEEFWTDRKVPL